jgi:hypothetical protein
MMPLPFPEAQQDSIPARNIPFRDSVILKSDSASLFHTIQPEDSFPHRKIKEVTRTIPEITDTISVCRRNSIEDVTFYDSGNLVSRIETIHTDKFPLLFTAKGRIISEEAKTSLVKHLRAGDEMPYIPYHNDWIILILLCAAFLFAIIRKSSDNILHSVERFFLFRGINDPSSRDIGGLFTWESTIKNLTSFLVLGLFGYAAAAYHNVIPSALSGIIFWIISVMLIMTAITFRHLICLITGAVSGEREVFLEYLLSIYQFYRFSAILLFVVTILISYTTIFSVETDLIAGAIVLAILYLIRVMRLFIIFINKNISLFYLILYLCALEILPVLISVKYFSGLA